MQRFDWPTAGETVVSECRRARSRAELGSACRYYAAAAAEAGKSEMEVVEAADAFGSCLPVCTWAGFGWVHRLLEDTGEQCKPRARGEDADGSKGRGEWEAHRQAAI